MARRLGLVGDPYAVACAAQLPERVVAGIILGGVTDMGWPGAWEGYINSEIELMRLRDEAAAITWWQEWFGADGSGFLEASDFELAELDNTLLTHVALAGVGAVVRHLLAFGGG